jgi:hypothetical protein
MVVFYHAMEVSCYHFFWAVKSRLCLRLVTLGSVTIGCVQMPQVISLSAQDVKFITDFEVSIPKLLKNPSRLSSDHPKSNLFGPQDCLKRCRGGHQGELIHLIGIPLAPTI